jgi:HD superfamily phosphohydrolase
VFPGASHNRFEHSVGVSHLAYELMTRLKVRFALMPSTRLQTMSPSKNAM